MLVWYGMPLTAETLLLESRMPTTGQDYIHIHIVYMDCADE